MLKRSPLNKRGKKSLRESKVSPEHQHILDIFWAKVSQFTHDGQSWKIIDILKECSQIGGTKTASRYNFDRIKHRFKTSGYTCLVCTEDAQVRHHIIQIQHGGPNAACNVCALCDGCHAKVHPWLTKENSNVNGASSQ